MKKSISKSIEIVVYVVFTIVLLLGAWRLNSVYNNFKVRVC